jgi:hypothetical protein
MEVVESSNREFHYLVIVFVCACFVDVSASTVFFLPRSARTVEGAGCAAALTKHFVGV